MALIVTPKEEITAYFESDRMSQSLLKKMLKGPRAFKEASQDAEGKELHYNENASFVIGSGIDDMLTGGSELFESLYYVSQIEKKPTPVEMSICHSVFDKIVEHTNEMPEGPIAEYPQIILDAAVEHVWQPNWKAETRITKLGDALVEYFEDLKRAYGKQIISQNEKTAIYDIVMSLRTNDLTKQYFDHSLYENSSEVDIYYQLPIYFTYRGIESKVLLDILVVVHRPDGSCVFIPLDIKSTFNDTHDFIIALKSYRYDIQGAWYSNALNFWALQQGITTYEIQNFKFIVESTSYIGTPLVYQMTDQLMDIGRSGRKTVSLVDTDLFSDEIRNNAILVYPIKGFEQLLDEFLFYEEHGWEVHKNAVHKGTFLELDWEGIVTEDEN